MKQGTSVKFVGVEPSFRDQNEKLEDQIDQEEQEDDVSEDEVSVLSDFKPELKSRNFEFTDNSGIMRVLRVVLFLQIIAIVLDSPSMRVPTFFSVFCTKIFFYVLHFYSRPFLDICYVIQNAWNWIYNNISANLKSVPTNKIPGRRLTVRLMDTK